MVPTHHPQTGQEESYRQRARTIVKEELADHPGGVRTYPQDHRRRMVQVAAIEAGAPADPYRQPDRGQDHGNTKPPQVHHPKKVLDQPEEDVEVLSPPDSA